MRVYACKFHGGLRRRSELAGGLQIVLCHFKLTDHEVSACSYQKGGGEFRVFLDGLCGDGDSSCGTSAQSEQDGLEQHRLGVGWVPAEKCFKLFFRPVILPAVDAILYQGLPPSNVLAAPRDVRGHVLDRFVPLGGLCVERRLGPERQRILRIDRGRPVVGAQGLGRVVSGQEFPVHQEPYDFDFFALGLSYACFQHGLAFCRLAVAGVEERQRPSPLYGSTGLFVGFAVEF